MAEPNSVENVGTGGATPPINTNPVIDPLRPVDPSASLGGPLVDPPEPAPASSPTALNAEIQAAGRRAMAEKVTEEERAKKEAARPIRRAVRNAKAFGELLKKKLLMPLTRLPDDPTDIKAAEAPKAEAKIEAPAPAAAEAPKAEASAAPVVEPLKAEAPPVDPKAEGPKVNAAPPKTEERVEAEAAKPKPQPAPPPFMTWYRDTYLNLPIYGTEGNALWSRIVSGYFTWLSRVILMMMVVDGVGFTLYIWGRTRGLPLPGRLVVLAAFVSTLLVLTAAVDSSLANSSTAKIRFPSKLDGTSRWSLKDLWPPLKTLLSYTGRIAFSGFVAYMVAQPLVDLFTRKRVEQFQSEREGAYTQTLRDREIRRIRIAYGTRIADGQETAPQRDATGSTRCRVGTRCEEHESMVRREANELNGIDSQITAQLRSVNGEGDGVLGSRHVGSGPVFRAKLQMLNDLRGQRVAMTTRHASEEAAFNTVTQSLPITLGVQRDREITEVTRLSNLTLMVRFGNRGAREDRDYFGRMNARDALQEQDRNFDIQVKLTEIMFMLPFILFMLLKLFEPRQVKRYLSEAAQAASGHKDAQAALAREGVTDFVVYAMPTEMRRLRLDLFKLVIALNEELDGLDVEIRRVAQRRNPEDKTQFLTLEEVHEELRRFTAFGLMSAVKLVRNAANRFRMALGLNILIWEPDWNHGIDPLDENYRYWFVSKERLALDGWVDPTIKAEALAPLFTELDATRELIVDKLIALDSGSRDLLGGFAGPPAPPTAVRAIRSDEFRDIRPLYLKLDELTRAIKKAGGKIPNWEYKDRPVMCDPTNVFFAQRYAQNPSDIELRFVNGGKLPNEIPTVDKSVVAPPAPVPTAPKAKPKSVPPPIPTGKPAASPRDSGPSGRPRKPNETILPPAPDGDVVAVSVTQPPPAMPADPNVGANASRPTLDQFGTKAGGAEPKVEPLKSPVGAAVVAAVTDAVEAKNEPPASGPAPN